MIEMDKISKSKDIEMVIQHQTMIKNQTVNTPIEPVILSICL